MEISTIPKFLRITMFQFKTYNRKSRAFKNTERDITASGVFKKAAKVRNPRFR